MSPQGRGGRDYVAELQTSAGKEAHEACMFYRRSSGEGERKKSLCCLEGRMFMLQGQMWKGMWGHDWERWGEPGLSVTWCEMAKAEKQLCDGMALSSQNDLTTGCPGDTTPYKWALGWTTLSWIKNCTGRQEFRQSSRPLTCFRVFSLERAYSKTDRFALLPFYFS